MIACVGCGDNQSTDKECSNCGAKISAEAKFCSSCGETVLDTSGSGNKDDGSETECSHNWQSATCTEAKTCSKCGETSGNALGHSYENGKCKNCGTKSPVANSPATIVGIDNADIKDDIITMFVDKSTESIMLSSKVATTENTKWLLYSETDRKIETKKATLSKGWNTYYILAQSLDESVEKTYTLKIYRSFDVEIKYYDGDILLHSSIVESGKSYTPDYEYDKIGYTSNGWVDENGEKYVAHTIWENECLYAENPIVLDEMSNFIFTSTNTTCEITGVKDITVSKIIVPDYVTSIANSAFERFMNLTNITIGNGVTSIGDKAFYYCSCLTTVVIGNNVERIGDNAFFGCGGLTSVTIPSSVTNIGKSAFDCCSGLEQITIPHGVKSIGSSAFRYCERISTISIPNSVTSIGSSAFFGCSNLSSITLSNSITSLSNFIFYLCSNLKNITIPNGIVSIGDSAFANCTNLTSITIPTSVKTIGDSAFHACKKLTNVTLGNSVTSIGGSAFGACSSLTSITIPMSVNSIGIYAFSGCSKLVSVTLENPNGWICIYAATNTTTNIPSTSLSDPYTVATYLTSTSSKYRDGDWKRN